MAAILVALVLVAMFLTIFRFGFFGLAAIFPPILTPLALYQFFRDKPPMSASSESFDPYALNLFDLPLVGIAALSWLTLGLIVLMMRSGLFSKKLLRGPWL